MIYCCTFSGKFCLLIQVKQIFSQISHLFGVNLLQRSFLDQFSLFGHILSTLSRQYKESHKFKQCRDIKIDCRRENSCFKHFSVYKYTAQTSTSFRLKLPPRRQQIFTAWLKLFQVDLNFVTININHAFPDTIKYLNQNFHMFLSFKS